MKTGFNSWNASPCFQFQSKYTQFNCVQGRTRTIHPFPSGIGLPIQFYRTFHTQLGTIVSTSNPILAGPMASKDQRWRSTHFKLTLFNNLEEQVSSTPPHSKTVSLNAAKCQRSCFHDVLRPDSCVSMMYQQAYEPILQVGYRLMTRHGYDYKRFQSYHVPLDQGHFQEFKAYIAGYVRSLPCEWCAANGAYIKAREAEAQAEQDAVAAPPLPISDAESTSAAQRSIVPFEGHSRGNLRQPQAQCFVCFTPVHFSYVFALVSSHVNPCEVMCTS